MTGKREKPEEIVSKHRQVEVLQGQGATIAEAVRQIGVTQPTFYYWRKLYGGLILHHLLNIVWRYERFYPTGRVRASACHSSDKFGDKPRIDAPSHAGCILLSSFFI